MGSFEQAVLAQVLDVTAPLFKLFKLCTAGHYCQDLSMVGHTLYTAAHTALGRFPHGHFSAGFQQPGSSSSAGFQFLSQVPAPQPGSSSSARFQLLGRVPAAGFQLLGRVPVPQPGSSSSAGFQLLGRVPAPQPGSSSSAGFQLLSRVPAAGFQFLSRVPVLQPGRREE